MSDFQPEKPEMSEVAFASEMLRERIAPPGIAPSVKERVSKAARALRWSYSRTRDVWYRDPRVSIKPRELRDIARLTGVEYGRQELTEIDALIAKADNLVMGGDPDFHSAFVAAARAFYRALRRARAGGAR